MIDPDSGEVSPRKCDLRAFVVTGQNTHVWYSGLTRYSSVPGQMIVNSSQGGGFKDTWVLAPEDGSTDRQREESVASVNLIPHSKRHSLSLVTASKADNLYWLGRYTERAFTTLVQFFPFYDRVMDTDVDAFRPFAKALDLPQDFEDFDGFIHSFLYDGTNPRLGALRHRRRVQQRRGAAPGADVEAAAVRRARGEEHHRGRRAFRQRG